MALTSTFEDPNCPRLFSLKMRGLKDHAQPSNVLIPNQERTLFILNSPIRIMGHPTIGVFVDGACEGNGTPSAKAGFGVFFGQNSRYNLRGKLPVDSPQTSQRAELTAAIFALSQIELIAAEDKSLELFIIISDSAYLVNSITAYIVKWKQNGWKTSSGKDVVNRDLFETLDLKIHYLSRQNEGIDVLFWKVHRSENQEADRLARSVLSL